MKLRHTYEKGDLVYLTRSTKTHKQGTVGEVTSVTRFHNSTGTITVQFGTYVSSFDLLFGPLKVLEYNSQIQALDDEYQQVDRQIEQERLEYDGISETISEALASRHPDEAKRLLEKQRVLMEERSTLWERQWKIRKEYERITGRSE